MFPILSLSPALTNEFSPKKKGWFKDVPIIYKYNKNETSGLLFGESCWYSIDIAIPLPISMEISRTPLRLCQLRIEQKVDMGYIDGWSSNIFSAYFPPGDVPMLQFLYKTNNLKEYNRLCRGEDLLCSH